MKLRSCQINPEQVRLLLFKECDWRGRKLLFDSSTIEKVISNKNDKPNIRQDVFPCNVEVSEGFTYLYKGPATDASVLGEMIFGAVAISCKTVSLKIHIMDEPRRLMCAKVFCVPTSRKISRTERRSDVSSRSSGNITEGSKPLNVPTFKEEGVSLSFSLDRGDSGFCGDVSPYSSMGSTFDYFSMFDVWDGNRSQVDVYSFHSPPGRKLSTCSNGSWQRRSFQNMATRFDVGQQSANLLNVPTAASNATFGDLQVCSRSSTSGTSDSLLSTVSSPPKKNKLGLALLFTVSDSTQMDMVRRCVEHSSQLQALVCRLRLATLTAGAGSGFISTLYRATADAARWLSDLMYGPRLQPVWLNVVNCDAGSAAVIDTLLSDLCSVLSIGDTKSTNFFISTLLTHVLTYHLGWVTTVSPYDVVDSQKRLDPTDELQRPYNALWAQLSDLTGCIGFPPRAAKTIISGATNVNFINRLLLVLTYFVRCGEVKRKDFKFDKCIIESKVVEVNETQLKPRSEELRSNGDLKSCHRLKVPSFNTQTSNSNSSLAASDVSIKRTSTLANLNQQLLSSSEYLTKNTKVNVSTKSDMPMTSQLKRNPTVMMSLKSSSDSSLYSSVSEESEVEQKVVFVLGDDEKLVGLKNKSNDGKCVKKSTKIQNVVTTKCEEKKETCAKENCDREKSSDSPSKCCGQTLQHSKPIKHSGFKFEFDKYPQIVTNYMKSKNLEILDRHYIGKPGNLKLDNFQFDPTIVPPIQEERCETCYKCQLMESILQTPTNASEMEYMNDMPPQEPQYAKETIVSVESSRETTPKTFVRQRKENTVVVNVGSSGNANLCASLETLKSDITDVRKDNSKIPEVKQVLELPVPPLGSIESDVSSGFDKTLFGGVTDHYVPDLIVQGTISKSNAWENELRRDLDLTSYLNKTLDPPIQAVAIVGDTNNWEVRVVGRSVSGAGLSPLVGAMLEPLPAMRRANVPPRTCLAFLEGKLREFCVLSKTLADLLMSIDFCDIATLTKTLNIDVNDVPLLLAIATTHTPQVAARYGISYR